MSGMFFARPLGSSNNNSNSQVIIEHPLVSHEWIIDSPFNYPDVIIHVQKRGEVVLDPPQVVTAFWENITPQRVRIKFDNVPCSGFVVLQ